MPDLRVRINDPLDFELSRLLVNRTKIATLGKDNDPQFGCVEMMNGIGEED